MTTCALANPACQKQPDERNLMTGGAPIQLIHCHTTVIIGDTLSHQIIIIIIISGDVMIIIDHLCQITSLSHHPQDFTGGELLVIVFEFIFVIVVVFVFAFLFHLYLYSI